MLFLPLALPDGSRGERLPPGVSKPVVTKAGWYGNYRAGGWYDPGDNNIPKWGPSNEIPGVALPNSSLGRQFVVVEFPNKKRIMAIVSDEGPAGFTGRGLDVNARLAQEAGYRPGNYPTDAPHKYWLLGRNQAQARQRALALRAQIPGFRIFGGAAGGLGETMGKAAKPNGHAPLEGGSLSELLGSITGQSGGQAQAARVEQTPLPVPGFLSQPQHVARFARRRLTAGL